MKYIDLLKSENTYQGPLSELPKGGFDSSDSGGRRHFCKKKPRDLAPKSVRGAEPLPADCPILTGGACPPGCRFEWKFYLRMVGTGVLPDPETGCPLRHVCAAEGAQPLA